MIHMDMYENETESTKDTWDKVIYECPDGMSTDIMQECGFEKIDDIKQNDLSEENKTGIEKEEGKVSTETENADIIHSNMNGNKTDTNQDTSDRVIEELQDDTSPDIIEDCGNGGLDDSKQKIL